MSKLKQMLGALVLYVVAGVGCAADDSGSLALVDSAASAGGGPVIPVLAMPTTAGTYVLFAHPLGGAGRLYLCRGGLLADCQGGGKGAEMLRWFKAENGNKVYASEPFAITSGEPLHLVAVDPLNGTRQAERSLRFVNKSSPTPSLILHSPKERQIFQRTSVGSGVVEIRLPMPSMAGAKSLRAKLTGKAAANGAEGSNTWQEFDLKPDSNNEVTAKLQAPAGGFFALEVEVQDADAKVLSKAKVAEVGIGEVFLVAGGSNASHCAAFVNNSQSSLVLTSDGSSWQPAEDRKSSRIDAAACGEAQGLGGSYWPLLGDRLVQELKVPVAFVYAAYDQSAMSDWLPDAKNKDDLKANLFQSMLQRLRAAGPAVRAVLWHHGEQDSALGTSGEQYRGMLSTLIDALRVRAGYEMPWLVAQASYCRSSVPGTAFFSSSPSILFAQASVSNALTRVYLGPNSDDLSQSLRGTPKDSDACVFNAEGQREMARLWSMSIMRLSAIP